MSELEQKRQERDDEFNQFMTESAKVGKHTAKAQAARARYMLAQARKCES